MSNALAPKRALLLLMVGTASIQGAMNSASPLTPEEARAYAEHPYAAQLGAAAPGLLLLVFSAAMYLWHRATRRSARGASRATARGDDRSEEARDPSRRPCPFRWAPRYQVGAGLGQ